MALELTVNDIEEFQQMVDSKDFRISESVVNTILDNLNTRKKHVHIITINVINEGSVLEMTLERKFFAETLEENLKHFIEQERYEDCQKIVNAINKLKEQENGQNNKKRPK